MKMLEMVCVVLHYLLYHIHLLFLNLMATLKTSMFIHPFLPFPYRISPHFQHSKNANNDTTNWDHSSKNTTYCLQNKKSCNCVHLSTASSLRIYEEIKSSVFLYIKALLQLLFLRAETLNAYLCSPCHTLNHESRYCLHDISTRWENL